MTSVGDAAPALSLTAHDRSTWSLADHAGQRVVVAFYPAAFTGVCTKEMCTFTEAMATLGEANATVVGISVDAPFSNAAFADANGIGFPLLSDVHREACTAWGVALDDFVISGYTVSQRAVFVVEADGTVGWAWVAENPGQEPDYDAVIAHCAQ
jgi:peroxiredoxin